MVFVMGMSRDCAGDWNLLPPNSSRRPQEPVHGQRRLGETKLWARGLSRSTVPMTPLDSPPSC